MFCDLKTSYMEGMGRSKVQWYPWDCSKARMVGFMILIT